VACACTADARMSTDTWHHDSKMVVNMKSCIYHKIEAVYGDMHTYLKIASVSGCRLETYRKEMMLCGQSTTDNSAEAKCLILKKHPSMCNIG
jgi:hypothetical protein